MHAAERAFALVESNVALHDAGIEAVRFEFMLTKGACKKTALVFPALGFQNERALQLCVRKDQTVLLGGTTLLRICLCERLRDDIIPAQRCIEAA